MKSYIRLSSYSYSLIIDRLSIKLLIRPNYNVRVKSGLILGCGLIRTLVTLVCFGDRGLILGKKRGLILGYNIWLQKGYKT
jgi:hypothetical protein